MKAPRERNRVGLADLSSQKPEEGAKGEEKPQTGRRRMYKRKRGLTELRTRNVEVTA